MSDGGDPPLAGAILQANGLPIQPLDSGPA